MCPYRVLGVSVHRNSRPRLLPESKDSHELTVNGIQVKLVQSRRTGAFSQTHSLSFVLSFFYLIWFRFRDKGEFSNIVLWYGWVFWKPWKSYRNRIFHAQGNKSFISPSRNCLIRSAFTVVGFAWIMKMMEKEGKQFIFKKILITDFNKNIIIKVVLFH